MAKHGNTAVAPVTPGGIVRGDTWAGAEFSPCGRYRFRLWRDFRTPRFLELWESVIRGEERPRPGPGRFVAFAMCNPSDADHNDLDNTTRRVDGFARRWGFDGWLGVNLSPWIETKSRKLSDATGPEGTENGHALVWAIAHSTLFACAWGATPFRYAWGAPERDALMYRLERAGVVPHHLGLTKDGHPRHPLYLRGDTKPQLWSGP